MIVDCSLGSGSPAYCVEHYRETPSPSLFHLQLDDESLVVDAEALSGIVSPDPGRGYPAQEGVHWGKGSGGLASAVSLEACEMREHEGTQRHFARDVGVVRSQSSHSRRGQWWWWWWCSLEAARLDGRRTGRYWGTVSHELEDQGYSCSSVMGALGIGSVGVGTAMS